MDRDTLHERADDPRVADRAAARVVHVAVEDDQVGQLPDLERARLGIEVVDVRVPIVNPASASSSVSRSSGRNGSAVRS